MNDSNQDSFRDGIVALFNESGLSNLLTEDIIQLFVGMLERGVVPTYDQMTALLEEQNILQLNADAKDVKPPVPMDIDDIVYVSNDSEDGLQKVFSSQTVLSQDLKLPVISHAEVERLPQVADECCIDQKEFKPSVTQLNNRNSNNEGYSQLNTQNSCDGFISDLDPLNSDKELDLKDVKVLFKLDPQSDDVASTHVETVESNFFAAGEESSTHVDQTEAVLNSKAGQNSESLVTQLMTGCCSSKTDMPKYAVNSPVKRFGDECKSSPVNLPLTLICGQECPRPSTCSKNVDDHSNLQAASPAQKFQGTINPLIDFEACSKSVNDTDGNKEYIESNFLTLPSISPEVESMERKSTVKFIVGQKQTSHDVDKFEDQVLTEVSTDWSEQKENVVGDIVIRAGLKGSADQPLIPLGKTDIDFKTLVTISDRRPVVPGTDHSSIHPSNLLEGGGHTIQDSNNDIVEPGNNEINNTKHTTLGHPPIIPIPYLSVVAEAEEKPNCQTQPLIPNVGLSDLDNEIVGEKFLKLEEESQNLSPPSTTNKFMNNKIIVDDLTDFGSKSLEMNDKDLGKPSISLNDDSQNMLSLSSQDDLGSDSNETFNKKRLRPRRQRVSTKNNVYEVENGKDDGPEEEEDDLECVICQKIFQRASRLKRHILNCHENAKNSKLTGCKHVKEQHGKRDQSSPADHPPDVNHDLPGQQSSCSLTVQRPVRNEELLNGQVSKQLRESEGVQCFDTSCSSHTVKRMTEVNREDNHTLDSSTAFSNSGEGPLSVTVDVLEPGLNGLKGVLCGAMLKEETSLIKHMEPTHVQQTLSSHLSGKQSTIVVVKQSEEIKKSDSEPNFNSKRCTRCNRIFTTMSSLTRHNKRIHGIRFRSEVMQCSSCDKTFHSKSATIIHIKSAHQNVGFMKCAVCGKQYGKSETRLAHQNHCPLMFEMHGKTVEDSEPATGRSSMSTIDGLVSSQYKCDFCSKYFPLQHHLQVHKNTCHKERINAAAEAGPSQVDKWSCDFCDVRCTTYKNLKRHTQLQHINDSDKVKCDLCENGDSTFRDLEAHLRTHRRQWIDWHIKKGCQYNNESSTRKSDANTQVKKIAALDESSLHCRNDEQGTQQRSLKSNISIGLEVLSSKKSKTSHLIFNKFKCRKCKAIFSRKNQLESHKMSAHPDCYTPWVNCKLCPEKLLSKSHLIEHSIEAHGNFVSFRCKICNATHASLDGIRTHMKQEHITEFNGSFQVTEDSPASNPCDSEQASASVDQQVNKSLSMDEDKQPSGIPGNDVQCSLLLVEDVGQSTLNDEKDKSQTLKLKQKAGNASNERSKKSARNRLNQSPVIQTIAMKHSIADGENENCSLQQNHADTISCSETVPKDHTKLQYSSSTCSECCVIFCSIHALNVHIMEFHLETEFHLEFADDVFEFPKANNCRFCHEQFCSVFSKDEHEETHCGEVNPYKCTTCGHCFNGLNSLLKHMLMHIKVGLYICIKCNIYFEDYEACSYHMQSHHKKLRVRRKGKYLPHCSRCDIKFSSICDYKKHKSQGLCVKTYLCSFCGMGFYRNYVLQAHVRQEHTGERPYKCTVCDKAFSVAKKLRLHLLSKHSRGERKESLCAICGKTFKGSSLYIHENSHTRRRTYKCKICSFEFTQGCSLQRHMKTHSKSKRDT